MQFHTVIYIEGWFEVILGAFVIFSLLSLEAWSMNICHSKLAIDDILILCGIIVVSIQQIILFNCLYMYSSYQE